MMTAQRRALFAADGYASGLLEHPSSPGWPDFAASWDRLPTDRYMADGGTYRERRFSELRCDDDELEPLPRRSFSQPREVNSLNGGVERWFEPFEPDTLASPVLDNLLRAFVRTFDELERQRGPWLVQAFQNRTLARPNDPGLPTPEGVHRDGMDYNVIVLMGRSGVIGGTNTVYAGDSRAPLRRMQLTVPGEYLITDDRRLMHDATPVTLADEAAEVGYRDALVVSFTRL
jgi:hypothetical protein